MGCPVCCGYPKQASRLVPRLPRFECYGKQFHLQGITHVQGRGFRVDDADHYDFLQWEALTSLISTG